MVINWVPGIRWACIVDDCTLSVYNLQLLLCSRVEIEKEYICVEWHRPVGVIMYEVMWALNFYLKIHYKCFYHYNKIQCKIREYKTSITITRRIFKKDIGMSYSDKRKQKTAEKLRKTKKSVIKASLSRNNNKNNNVFCY